MAKLTLTDVAAGYGLTTTVNTNNDGVEAAIENTLSRDGTSPNAMSANLDMNSNRVINVTDGANNQDACTVAQLNAASVVATTIAGSAVTIADAGTYFTGTTAEGVLQELGATTGAGVIGLLDTAGNVAATNVEDAIAEVYTDSAAATAALAATSNGNGAALIGVEDAATNFTATNVEAVLAEIQANVVAVTATKGSFTGTLTGYASNPTGTFYWNKLDLDGTHSKVTLWADPAGSGVTGTSNANTMTMTGIPAAINPTTNSVGEVLCLVYDAGTSGKSGYLQVANNNVITFYVDPGTGTFGSTSFTTSGTKGLANGWSASYIID